MKSIKFQKDLDNVSPTPNTYSQGPRYKSYNQEYLNPQQVSNFQQNPYNNQSKQMNQFNNFDNTNSMWQPPQSNFNNSNQSIVNMNQQLMMNKPVQNTAQQKPKLNVQGMSIDDIGDFIYSYCEKLYPK